MGNSGNLQLFGTTRPLGGGEGGMRAFVTKSMETQDRPVGSVSGYEGLLLKLVPSQVSWGRHHRVDGTQAIIGN